MAGSDLNSQHAYPDPGHGCGCAMIVTVLYAIHFHAIRQCREALICTIATPIAAPIVFATQSLMSNMPKPVTSCSTSIHIDTALQISKETNHKVHAQHGLNASCRTAALSTGVIRLDNVDPLIPRNDGIHHVQKLFTLCFALTVGIFNVTESHLGHNHTILSREHIILHLIILFYHTYMVVSVCGD